MNEDITEEYLRRYLDELVETAEEIILATRERHPPLIVLRACLLAARRIIEASDRVSIKQEEWDAIWELQWEEEGKQ